MSHDDDESGLPGETPTPEPRPFHTDLPPTGMHGETNEGRRNGNDAASSDPGEVPALSAEKPAIPATPLAAYRGAAASLRMTHPGSRLPWELLAAIGMVESGHGWGGAVDDDGVMLEPIIEERRGSEADGPMRLTSAVWALWGTSSEGDGEGDGDPQNIHDATLSAGRFLCAPGRDLSRTPDLHQAIRSFHDSPAYLKAVLFWMESYRAGVRSIPDRTEVGWSSFAAPLPAPELELEPAGVDDSLADDSDVEDVEDVVAEEVAVEEGAVTVPLPVPVSAGSASGPVRTKRYGRTRSAAAGPPGRPAPSLRRRTVRGAAGAALTAVMLLGFPGPQLADLLDDPGPGISEGAEDPQALPGNSSTGPEYGPGEQETEGPTTPPPSEKPKPKPKPEPEPSESKAPPAQDTADDTSTQNNAGSADSDSGSQGAPPKQADPTPKTEREAPGSDYYDWTKWLPGQR